MASSNVATAATTADTPINLKINIDGTTRRLKLPLRDLGAHVFEDKLRAILHIPSDVEATVERYSDSATSYVTLNRTNIAVYKQLYRAAKAKQKLKLRVTTKREPVTPPAPTPVPEPVKDTTAPKPVTIEDEPEEEAKSTTPVKVEEEPKEDVAVEKTESPLPKASGVAETVVAPQTNHDFPQFVAQWRARGNPRIHLRRNCAGVEVVDFLQHSSTTEPLVTRDSSEGVIATTTTPQVEAPTSLATLARSIQERERQTDGFRKTTPNNMDIIAPFENLRISSEHFGSASTSGTKSPETSNNIATEQADYYTGLVNSIRGTDADLRKTREIVKKLHEVRAKAVQHVARSMTSDPVTPKVDEAIAQQESMRRPFTVCCNSCDRAVPEAHYHCSICDEGDFDLCQDCVNRGISCHGEGHWLIKRTVVNGDIKCSSTHIAPKSFRSASLKIVPKPASPLPSPVPLCYPPTMMMPLTSPWNPQFNNSARTCNSCVQEFREAEFVQCTSCDDYDLCKGCFAKNQHRHHPKHGFTAAVKGSVLDEPVSSRLAPGRNVLHNAICDGCDKYVRGIRHKCLDCPDWDYCSDCVKDASFIHPNHRFVAIYEPLADRPFRTSSRATHYGISCDGPLCKSREGGCRYIVGERYKCAVCHDTDFCANCEASPANTHNKTHPLIKFKTPVRHVSVTTTGEHEDGQRLPTMGDRSRRSRNTTQSPSTSTCPKEKIAATPVQTVVDVQPTEQLAVPVPTSYNKVDIKDEVSEAKPSSPAEPVKETVVEKDLVAIFKWDTIEDGSVLPPNHTFEQTWVLRNEGTVPWPAGCSVKFVGGDYMGAIDPAHPAGIHELVSASESTVCYNALNPGQEFPFTVLMRTPDRDGKVISYWRLTTPDGVKFGHKLWCDVVVQASTKSEPGVTETSDVVEPVAKVEETAPASISESQMIIPKLEHESPSGSTFMDARPELEVETESDTLAASAVEEEDDFEDCGQDDWAEDSASGFMTDEEYDILDASDEEFLFEQQKMLSKK
ncbi:hypothetical protein F5Y08DRAFT_284350 [Xylaria arbuscula]|nr:hypothetical protein F5Y08DRAFT_284350 [Xylaria arbuscula]